MLRSGRLDEATVQRAIETIDRNAKAQAQLVEDILDVSRVITGKLRLNMGSVDVAAVINAAIDSVQWAADSKGIERQTPAVALTSHVSIEDRARALSAGFNMFVPKPVEPNELITAIANLAAPDDPPV